MKVFARNIRLVRTCWRMKQDQFATFFDLSRSQVASYEQGAAVPRIDFLLAFSKTIGISIERLFSDNIAAEDIPASPLDGAKEFAEIAKARPKEDTLYNFSELVEFVRNLESRIKNLEGAKE